ncbi:MULTISPECIES: hypothetical protein [unclassified Streptomyces]|uniref:hypothetical protein n=1 Tax=unclassified Streptomyces TaxID=2593676 RepID=UPI0036E9978B
MGAIRRRLAVGLAVVTASGVLGIAAPGQAQAADTQCEGRKIRTYTFSTGSVKVYRRGQSLCAVTVPKRVGTPRTMMVSLRARGFEAVVDQGVYTKRAGPVWSYVGSRKVWIKGRVGGGSYSTGGWVRL